MNFFLYGSFLSRHLASAPSRNFQGTIYDICRGNIHPDFSATWRLHTNDEELTRFLSHIHQENINCWYFVKKPRPFSSPNGPNDISNIIYFSLWWHCWREDCSRYLHSRLCSQVNVLGEGYRPATVRTSAPSRKVSAPSRKVTELRVMEIVSFLKRKLHNRFNLISEERVNGFQTITVKTWWKSVAHPKEVMTFWSFANFQETFLDQSIWICKWVRWWCHRLTIFHSFCTQKWQKIHISAMRMLDLP